eukprot:6881450-Pyramimonas_sp.AAC.1
MAPRMLQKAPGPPQDDSNWPRSLPRRPPKRPKWLQRLREINVFCFLAVSLPMALEASRWFQDGQVPKRGPRWPQDGPKSAQERPKSVPRGVR